MCYLVLGVQYSLQQSVSAVLVVCTSMLYEEVRRPEPAPTQDVGRPTTSTEL